VVQRGFTRRPNLKLKALRINKGMGREDLARVTGVSIESIRLAEIGFVPGIKIQDAIARALGASILDIWPIELQR
jgi:DNA-binding XRE family transcriptional regulator